MFRRSLLNQTGFTKVGRYWYLIPISSAAFLLYKRYNEKKDERYFLDGGWLAYERDLASTSYFNWYLSYRLSSKTFRANPVFVCKDDLKVVDSDKIFPERRNIRGDTFLYAGEYEKDGYMNIDKEAFFNIKKGNYIICPKLLDIKTNRANGYEKNDIILTGTRDHDACRLFEEQFKDEMVRKAIIGDLEPDHPFSTARLYSIGNRRLSSDKEASNEEDKFVPLGKLLDIKGNPDLIGKGQIIYCPEIKTHLTSDNIFVPQDGKYYDDESVCMAFIFKDMQRLISKNNF